MPKCAFCGNQVEKGTGKLFIYNSGKSDTFCSNKCEKNLLVLKRKPLKVRWTEAYRKEHKKDQKEEKVEKKAEPKVEEKPKAEEPVEKKEEPKVEEKPKVEESKEE
jgi:ribosomal protein L24E